MNQLEKDYWPSIFNIRFLGYILLLLAVIDVINIFLPFRFTNPVWEFQMIGALVEHAPLPLIGLILVCFGERTYREKIEVYLLNFFSWASLLVGLGFLLLLPLGINNTWRINNQNSVQINNQSSQQIIQIKQVKEVLYKAKNNEDINQVFKSLNPQKNTPELQDPQKVKNELLSQMGQLETKLNNQAQAAKNNAHEELIRNSVKWNLGALICAFAFIWIWYATDWAR
ncbi:MAG: HpsJ family protein [Aulosira sp. DedQUE10]|nr:HpsJ family protein [Aulosira sp. DedQUE10]